MLHGITKRENRYGGGHALLLCSGCMGRGEPTACTDDSDCVLAQCCHPSGCMNHQFKEPCNELCTAVCEGPIDCGAGHCGCSEGDAPLFRVPVLNCERCFHPRAFGFLVLSGMSMRQYLKRIHTLFIRVKHAYACHLERMFC